MEATNYKTPLILAVALILSFGANAQDYKLTNDDLPEGSNIAYESTYGWDFENTRIPGSAKEAIAQKIITSNKEEIWIRYKKFASETSALKNVYMQSNNYVLDLSYGTCTGELIGDMPFAGLFYGWGGALSVFQIANFGVYFFGTDSKNATNYIVELSKIAIAKFEKYVDDKVVENNNALLNERISKAEFELITAKNKHFAEQKQYKHGKTDNSKWLINEEELSMGLRQNWINDNASYAIDAICLTDGETALNAAYIRDTLTYAPTFTIGHEESLEKALGKKEWSRKPQQFRTVTGVYDNYVLFYYGFNEEGIDVEEFKAFVLATDTEALFRSTHKEELETAQYVYPNPVGNALHLTLDGVIECSIYSLTGQKLKTVKQVNADTPIDVRFLNKGHYLVEVKTQKKTVNYRFVKE